MATTAFYPENILAWTDRLDEQDIVWANDPNSLAAEVSAIETTLGAMPQLESNPVAGPQVNFVSVNQRLDYMTFGQQIPVVQLTSNSQSISSHQGSASNYGAYNSYGTAIYDPYTLWNGSDVVVPTTGWYYVDAVQYWPWSVSGYTALHLLISSTLQDTDLWDWELTQNKQGGAWQGYSDIARPGCTHVKYSGIINQGARIRVVSENGTATSSVIAENMRLSVSMGPVTPPDPSLLPVPIPVGTSANPPTQVTRYPAPTWHNIGSTSHPWANLGNGNIELQWNRIPTSATIPIAPPSYTIAVYYTSSGGLASYTTVDAPDTSGAEAVTISNLQTGKSYQVHVWANNGLIAPPHATLNISI